MQAVILAGGKGTRLRPLTCRIPKAMVPVCKKPFLEVQIELLKKHGIFDLVLLVGYRRQAIQDYFGQGQKWGVTIQYSCENKLLGTAGALKKAGRFLRREFLLLNGDTYLSVDYRAMFAAFRRRRCLGLMATYHNSRGIFKNNVRQGTDGLVIGYDKQSRRGMNCVDAGAIVFSKRVIDAIPAHSAVSLEKEVFPGLIQARQLAFFRCRERFYDMGSPFGLRTLQEKLR